jgi:hypothetical protein
LLVFVTDFVRFLGYAFFKGGDFVFEAGELAFGRAAGGGPLALEPGAGLV